MEPDNAEDVCVERDDIKPAIHFVSIEALNIEIMLY
jgi:hypothetical protein